MNAKPLPTLGGKILESYGSIEGRLEARSVHGVRRIYVYDSLMNREVRCDFGDRVPLDEVLRAFDRRVSVTGTIKSRAKTGTWLSVQVSTLRLSRSDDELPKTGEILNAWRQRPTSREIIL
jgi:hypothetical protein